MAGKRIYETEAVKAFAAGMAAVARRKYDAALQVLRTVGFLRAPFAEKVEGHAGLFAIRIVADGNARFFYCYADGDLVLVLHGYEKRSARIPPDEIARALAVRDRLTKGHTA